MKIALTITIAFAMLLAETNAGAFCFKEAGDLYSINPLVLYAIAKQESSFNPKARHDNDDGSYDISLMQINSSHFGELARYGIHEQDLVNDPCLSAKVGAWILARNIVKYSNESKDRKEDPDGFWSAVGAYNAGTSKQNHNKRMEYAWLIYKHMVSVSAK